MWRITNFIQFLKDLVYWVPKIWQDRDWDPIYLYQFMRWKIERMAKRITKERRHIGWERDVRDMKVCIALLKRCELDDIYDDMYGFYERKKCEKCLSEHQALKKKYGEDSYFWHSCDPCVKIFRRNHNWLDAKKKADKTYLFKLLDKRADRWWT